MATSLGTPGDLGSGKRQEGPPPELWECGRANTLIPKFWASVLFLIAQRVASPGASLFCPVLLSSFLSSDEPQKKRLDCVQILNFLPQTESSDALLLSEGGEDWFLGVQRYLPFHA